MKKLGMNQKIKKAATMVMTMHFGLGMAMVSYAGDYGKNIATWGLDQAFWIVLLLMGISMAVSFAKHATVGIIITAVVGGVVAYACKNPEQAIKIGDALSRAVIGG